jgi:hypothetical protein
VGWSENLTELVSPFGRIKFSLKLCDAAELNIQITSDGANLEPELVDDGSQPSVRASRSLQL